MKNPVLPITDCTQYARTLGYDGEKPVFVQDGRVISHRSKDWFEFCEGLRTKHWRRNLHSGDEVTWRDPDGGACSRSGEILSIEYMGNDSARIQFKDGWQNEVMLRELC